MLIGVVKHTVCSKITHWPINRYGAFTEKLCSSQQIHQLKQEKSYILVTHTFIPYNKTKIWEIQVCIAIKYNFSHFNWWICWNGQEHYCICPVSLKSKKCVNQKFAVQNPQRAKNAKEHFLLYTWYKCTFC